MALHPGTRIGVFEITGRLGEGGMGEVYHARDSRLHRDVAIKIPPTAVVPDPDCAARFTREAQSRAALKHPHIAQIYGVEEGGDHRALIMDLVEGDTLAERLARGPLPIDEAVPVAPQIAEALEAAHEAGIILGTACYMAPEQAKGKAVDRRADIWAFGCVLFEMLTARTLFAGDTVAETLARVIEREPDLSALPASTPPAVRARLRRSTDSMARKSGVAVSIRALLVLQLLPFDGQQATASSSGSCGRRTGIWESQQFSAKR